MRRLRVAVVLVVGLVLLAACGTTERDVVEQVQRDGVDASSSGPASTTSSTDVDPSTDPTAASTLVATGGHRWVWALTLLDDQRQPDLSWPESGDDPEADDGVPLWQGAGRTDAGGDVHALLVFGQGHIRLPMLVRLVDGELYLAPGGALFGEVGGGAEVTVPDEVEGATWLHLDGIDPFGLRWILWMSDPSRCAESLEGAGARREPAPDVTIDGEAATVDRLAATARAATGAAYEQAADELASLDSRRDEDDEDEEDELAEQELVFDVVWVDGAARRLTTYDADAVGADDERVEATVLEVLEVGGVDDVEAPADARTVRTAGELDELLG